MWDQKFLIWVFLGWKLKTILSYLKSVPLKLPNFKISLKTKTPKFWTKNVVFGYFWSTILKNYCYI